MMLAAARDVLSIALKSLVRNPARSGLTVVGLAIGVAAFVAMVSFGEGARTAVVSQFEALGVNVLTVTREGLQASGRVPKRLDDLELEAIRREATGVEFAVPAVGTNKLIAHRGRAVVGKVMGTTPRFLEVRSYRFVSGGMFDAVDLAGRAKVCVIGGTPVKELFAGADPLGETITIDGALRCRIIGVLESKGTATSGRDLDDLVLTPMSTFEAFVSSPRRAYDRIFVRPRPEVARGAVRAELVRLLRRVREVPAGAKDDFRISSPDDATRVADQTSRILTGLLAGIAAVSLLVGGIGIMNIQLVAVAERTSEIGVRVSIGASPAQILVQFLTEAVVLAVAGTVLGAGLGIGISLAVAEAMGWPPTVPVGAVILSMTFGAAVGVLFGYLPAQRAARLDPIEALRRA